MVFPTENSPPSSSKTHLLKPCLTSIDESEAPQNRSTPSPPDLKFLPFSVSFNGWRFANKNFKSWARKMAALHEPIWRKAGIFEAVIASTYRINQNTDLVLGIAEKWCPDTNTFVFPWGETTITLEDVMVLLGFSVLGSPVFATLDSSGEKIRAKLEKELKKIREDKVQIVSQSMWMGRFMDSGDELEHVAFLALWLCYFVFPSRFYYLSKAVFPIAVLLSCGTRIALAPAVLAHLYADLSLLKNHITTSNGSTKIAPSALFKLVQVWTWERFKELQPKPNQLLKGEPRLALWHVLKQRTSDAWLILHNSKVDSFEWRPYTKTVENWEFPQFYPKKEMWIPVSPSLDDVFLSFARCIKVSELVGTYSVEHYFPNRVASQFGILQDVPCPANRNRLSQEAAWNDYNKPIDDLTLYIPSRFALPCVTPVFFEWCRKSFPGFMYSSEKNLVVESAETFKERNIIDDDNSFVPSGSIMNSTSKDGMKIPEVLYKRSKFMKRARENDEITMGCCQTQTPSDDDEVDGRVTIAQMVGPDKKKYSDVKNTSEPLGKKSRLQDNNDLGPCQKLASISDDGDETVPPPKIEQRNEETDELGSKAGKNMVESPFDENNSSEPPFDDIVVSPPETRQTCDDELDVYGSNAEKRNMVDDGSKKPDCLLHEDGIIAGEKASSDEKLCSSEAEKDDDVVVDDGRDAILPEKEQRNEETDEIGSKAGKNMVESPFDENNSSEPPFDDIVVSPPETRQTCDDELGVYGSNAEKKTMVDDGSKKPDCLLHEDGIIAGEKASSDEKLCSSEAEKEDDVFVDDDSLIQKKLLLEELALKADNNEPIPHQKLASGDTNGDETSRAYKSKVLSPSDESNIHIAIGEVSQRHDCLLHDNALGSDETMKSNAGNVSYEKRFQELVVLASSIDERITKAQKTVAWLKERRATKKDFAAARLI